MSECSQYKYLHNSKLRDTSEFRMNFLDEACLSMR